MKIAVHRPVPTQWDLLNVGAILDMSWPTMDLPAMVKLSALNASLKLSKKRLTRTVERIAW